MADPHFNGGPVPPRRAAFTLVELLVVISVIVILAAILLPVFASAREQSRKAACMANLKNISLALGLYVQDSDEMFLPRSYTDYSWTGLTKDGALVEAPLQPYLHNKKVAACPSDSSVWTQTGGQFPTSYAWSEKLGGLPFATVQYPANVVTFNEIWAFHMRRHSHCYDPYPECLGLLAGNETMLLFVDGHVRYTRNVGTNANPLQHDWRVDYFNVLPDDLGRNSYDVR